MNQKEPPKSAIVQFNFQNCNSINPIGLDELPHRSNFFYGNDSSKWCTDVPNYAGIIYENIYDNIDLKYYFNEDGLKYDFIVHPGGNPSDIAIKVDGAQNIVLGASEEARGERPKIDEESNRMPPEPISIKHPIEFSLNEVKGRAVSDRPCSCIFKK